MPRAPAPSTPLLPATLLATLLQVVLPGPAAAQAWPTGTATCRAITEAVLRGRVGDATDAFTPADASSRLRRNVRLLMQRLADGAAAATHHLPPRLERVLPDARVDGTPASLELWTFGDREAALVGCAIRPDGDEARISVQAYPSWDELQRHLREALYGDRDGDADAPE